MKVAQTICDECKSIKKESNGWFKIGVLKLLAGPSDAEPGERVQLTLGVVTDKELPGFEVHDICGQRCFHKHIDILLGLQGGHGSHPPALPERESPVEAELLPEVA